MENNKDLIIVENKENKEEINNSNIKKSRKSSSKHKVNEAVNTPTIKTRRSSKNNTNDDVVVDLDTINANRRKSKSKDKISQVKKEYVQHEKVFNTKELEEGVSMAIKIIKKYQKDYYNDWENVKAFPQLKPGFISKHLSPNPPQQPESMKKILEDTEKYIIPGMRHWQHPNFYGFFPSTMSHQAVLGDFLKNAFLAIGFTWHANPASTELESLISDWLVEIFGLPEKFLIKNNGGGMLGHTTGDDIFTSVVNAKYKKLKELKTNHKDYETCERLVGYYTKHCHLQVFKALYIKDVKHIRELEIEMDKESGNYKLKKGYEEIIEKDIKDGLIPFFFGATIGTTSTGAFDDIDEISKICLKNNIFLLVDCAWAGSYFALDKYKYLSKSLEHANCVTINLAKCFMSGNGTAAIFIDDKKLLMETMAGKGSEYNQSAVYLKNEYSEDLNIIDYKDWQIGLGRPFNSLKVWYVIRGFGVEGIQGVLQKSIDQASYFTSMIEKDERFALHCKPSLGLVCVKVVKYHNGDDIPSEKINQVNKQLLELCNSTEDVFLTGGEINKEYFIRCSFSPSVDEEMLNIKFLYKVLSENVMFIK